MLDCLLLRSWNVCVDGHLFGPRDRVGLGSVPYERPKSLPFNDVRSVKTLAFRGSSSRRPSPPKSLVLSTGDSAVVRNVAELPIRRSLSRRDSGSKGAPELKPSDSVVEGMGRGRWGQRRRWGSCHNSGITSVCRERAHAKYIPKQESLLHIIIVNVNLHMYSVNT